MKKIASILLIAVLIFSLASCRDIEQEENFLETITFEEIAKANSSTNLLKKHKSVKERINNINTPSGETITWEKTYGKQGDYTNLFINMGDQGKNYYYNGRIYSYEEGEYSNVFHFRESYENIVLREVKPDNWLNSIYHTIVDRQLLKGGGYKVAFECKITPDIVRSGMFDDWKVDVGDKMQVHYYLKENLEISHYDYHLYNEKGELFKVIEIYMSYDEEIPFPQEIIDFSNTTDTCKVTFYENYGRGSQYSESFVVPKGLSSGVNQYLATHTLLIDFDKKVLWNTDNKISNDTEIYLTEEVYYYVDDAGDTIITRGETENE